LNTEYTQEKTLNTHYAFTSMILNKGQKQFRVLVYTGIFNRTRTRCTTQSQAMKTN